MPILSNPKHEIFAQELAKGTPACTAYVKAGYAKADSNASRLSGNDKVKARVAELLEIGAQQAGITIQWVIEEMRKIAGANMQDYMKSTEAGDPYLDFSQITRDQAAALAEVTVEDFKDGRSDSREVRRVKFKLHDKLSALEKLGKHLGMFKEQQEHSGKIEHVYQWLAPTD